MRSSHEVRDKSLAQSDVHPGQTEEELRGLLDTAGVALPELSLGLHRAPPSLGQLLKVTQGQLWILLRIENLVTISMV